MKISRVIELWQEMSPSLRKRFKNLWEDKASQRAIKKYEKRITEKAKKLRG